MKELSMKYLFVAACALAVTLGSSANQAQAKDRSFKNATAGIGYTSSGQRDHRGSKNPHGDDLFNRGGGVRVTPTCRWSNRC
jgi:hypothetical protein